MLSLGALSPKNDWLTMHDTAAIRLLILGSCVSRDIIEHQAQTGGHLKPVDYYARSSLASLAAIPFEMPLPSCLGSIKSPFQLRMVQRDMRKTFYNDLKTAEYDVLLLDLIDERFNLWAGSDGCLCTLSTELVQTGFRSQYQVGKEIVSGTDEFWNLWETGWTFFVQKLSALGVLDRVRVNKVFWSDTTQSGTNFSGISRQRIASANKFLERMYHRIAQDISAHQFMVFDKRHLQAADSHKWGIAPFHYVDEYYAAAIRQLIPSRAAIGAAIDHSNMNESVTAAYDIAAWMMPVYQYASIESAIDAGISSDGIYRIRISKDSTLDLCAQDLPLLASNERDRVILIGLNGAVAGRNGKKAPFFSGLGMACSLGLPVVAVSDPTLAMDPELSLSWYAGSEDLPDLPERLAFALEGLARVHRARLVIFGGSGGGFAAMLLATLLECRATVLVWNPQTSIADYVPDFVAQYLNAAFPGLRAALAAARAESAGKRGARLREVLDAAAITHDVRGIKPRAGVDILYLQNQDDWHVVRHAVPYLTKLSWDRVGEAAFMECNKQVGLFFGRWGEGHAAPPKVILDALLRKLAAGEPLADVVQALDGGLGGLCDVSPRFDWTMARPEMGVAPLRGRCTFNLASARIGNELVFTVNHSGWNDLRFAFYLYKDNQKVAVQWYSNNNVFRAVIEGVGEYLVRYFVVDAEVADYGAENPMRKISGYFDPMVID